MIIATFLWDDNDSVKSFNMCTRIRSVRVKSIRPNTVIITKVINKELEELSPVQLGVIKDSYYKTIMKVLDPIKRSIILDEDVKEILGLTYGN